MKRLFAMITALMLLTAVKAQDAAETPALSELMLISQPVMQLKSGLSRDYLTFYFDVKNIGVEKYKGEIMLIFEPDFEHFYAKEKIKVSSGKTRRVTFDVDVNKIYYDSVYNVVPVYCYENQWYQLTNYEAFDSLFVCLAHPDLQSVVDAAPCYVTNYYYIERPPRPLFYHFGAWYWGGYYDYYGGGYHYHYHYHTHIHYNDNPQTPPSEPATPTEPVPPVTPAEPVTPSPFHDRLDEIWSKIKKEKGQSPANPYYNSSATVTPAPIPTRTTNNGSYLTTPADSKKTTTTTTNTKPTTPTMPKYNNSTTFTTPASTSNKNTVTPATPAKPSTPTTPAKPTTPQWSSPSPAPTTTHKNTVTPAAPSKPTLAPTPAPRPTVTPNNSSSQKTNSGSVTPSKPSTPPTPSHNNSSSSKPAKSSRK